MQAAAARRAARWLLALALAGAQGVALAAPSALSLIVPAYFDATTDAADWQTLATTASKLPTTAILNPNSGPGTSSEPAYVAAIANVHAAGGKVIGYVSTSYAKRSLSRVIADINAYVSFYQLDGFFIDEMTADSTTAHVQFYQSVYNYIKGLNPNYSVTGNPGTNVPEIYASLPVADQLVVFESSAKAYATYQPLAWQANYPTSRFAHIIYNVGSTALAGTVDYAATHGAGGVYVTSLKLSNPYKALPPYWSTEVSDAAAP